MNSATCPSSNLIRMRDSASIQQAAQLMCDMSMGALGVDTKEHELLGIVTERDLLWAIAEGKDPHDTRLADVVNEFPIIVDGPIAASAAAARMVAGHVRHLLIRVNGVMNIVSLRDLVTADVQASNREAATHPISASEMRKMFGRRPNEAGMDRHGRPS